MPSATSGYLVCNALTFRMVLFLSDPDMRIRCPLIIADYEEFIMLHRYFSIPVVMLTKIFIVQGLTNSRQSANNGRKTSSYSVPLANWLSCSDTSTVISLLLPFLSKAQTVCERFVRFFHSLYSSYVSLFLWI